MKVFLILVTLGLFWALLSGHTELQLVVLGIISVLVTTWMCRYFGVFDNEIIKVKYLLGALLYLPYIVKEMLLANWGVVKEILKGKIDLSPTVKVVNATQKTTTGAFIYANSITFTPGTTTIKADVGRLEIYSITKGGAEDLAAGGMDRRVSKIHKDI